MIGFIAGALCLLAVAALIVWLGQRPGPRAADAGDPNLQWYRQRSRELDADDALLLEEARLRLLEDGVTEGADNAEPAAPGRVPAFLLTALLAVLAAVVYYSTGAVEDVLIYRELQAMSADDDQADRSELLGRIARRSAARPDNLQYLGLLGRLYMADANYGAARDSYAALAERLPEDPQALALAAQARFLAAERVLDSEAQLMAEQALAVDPTQRTALGLLGMASFESGAYRAATAYWERLQALEAPGTPGYQMLGEVLAMARQRAGLPAPEAPADAPGIADDAPGISVQLSLADGNSAAPDAAVFVFVRPAGAAGGMPIAARRLQAGELPVQLRLSDADSMAGQLLSESGAVEVLAQLSANGRPGNANALFAGSAGPVEAGGEEAAVSIALGEPPESG